MLTSRFASRTLAAAVLLVACGEVGPGPSNTPPTPAFTADCQWLTCTFVESSTDADGRVEAWAWDFGDSVSSTEQGPTHLYATPGQFTVTLRVTDDGGAEAATTRVVRVTQSARVAITLTLAGLDLDADGALITVDAAAPVPIAVNGTVTIEVAAGIHTLVLSGLAANCTADPMRQDIEVATGDVVNAVFTGTCTAATGVIDVGVTTTGADPDVDGYLVAVDGGPAQRVASNSVTPFAPILPGSHTILVSDLAANCTVTGPNPVTTVQVTAGGTVRDTARVQVSVVCATIWTGMDITVTTSGNDRDDRYFLVVCVMDYYYDCLPGGFAGPVPADTTVQLDLPPGYYDTYLSEVARNCTSTQTGNGSVAANQVTAVRIDVACTYLADFDVTVTATGSDVPNGIGLAISGWGDMQIPVGAPFRSAATEGSRSMTLVALPQNCQTTSPNPVSVTLVHGVVTPFAFTLSCEAFPRVVVTVNSAGTNLPAVYGLWVDSPTIWYAITPNDTVTLRVTPGAHAVWLDAIPSNCSVTSPNPIQLSSTLGQVIDAAFTVVCQ